MIGMVKWGRGSQVLHTKLPRYSLGINVANAIRTAVARENGAAGFRMPQRLRRILMPRHLEFWKVFSSTRIKRLNFASIMTVVSRPLRGYPSGLASSIWLPTC